MSLFFIQPAEKKGGSLHQKMRMPNLKKNISKALI